VTRAERLACTTLAAAPPAANVGAPAVASRRILIVDDASDAARDLARRVIGLGYEVVGVAASVGEATAMVGPAAVELLLVAPAHAATALGSAMPSIVVGAKDELARLADAAVDGRCDQLARPFTDRELRASIELSLCRLDAAQAVHRLEDRFFTESVDMLCFLDFNGYFKRLNPAWERTLGFTCAEMMARPFIEFVHPDDRERTLRQNREVREGGRALAFENRYLCKDGSSRWLRWNAAPDFSERVIYSMARDITENRQADAERDRLVRELTSALAEVNRLREILPICSYCRKIRDHENRWESVEQYISRHTTTQFSHGICPACMETEVEEGFRERA
jgi:PAS domain S-box-containing protein